MSRVTKSPAMGSAPAIFALQGQGCEECSYVKLSVFPLKFLFIYFIFLHLSL